MSRSDNAAVRCRTGTVLILNNTVRYGTVQYGMYRTVLYRTVLYRMIRYRKREREKGKGSVDPGGVINPGSTSGSTPRLQEYRYRTVWCGTVQYA